MSLSARRRRFAIQRRLGSDITDGISAITVESGPLITIGEVQPGECIVRVRACCVNYPDILRTCGRYQHKPTLPFIHGMEFSGIVTMVGENVHGIKVGDNVIGSGPGMASTVKVPAILCDPMPKGLTFEQAAAFRVGYTTAYHCLIERAMIKEGEVVLVNGATGGMGLAAVQVAKAVGATVIATGGSDAKLAVVKALGADLVINYTTDPKFAPLIKQYCGGASVVFDPVGGSVFEQGLRSTAWGARVVVVGFTSGVWPSVPANIVLIKGLSVLGARAGEFVRRNEDGFNNIVVPRMRQLNKWCGEGLLVPHVSHSFPIDRVGDAFRTLVERKVIGRVVVTFPSEITSNL